MFSGVHWALILSLEEKTSARIIEGKDTPRDFPQGLEH
jgi:hypothetical protein